MQTKEQRAECSRKYYQLNKEHLRECNIKWRQENTDRILECGRKYYQANKEKINKRGKKYKQKNKDRILECSRKYYQENKDKILEYVIINKEKIKSHAHKRYEVSKQFYRDNWEIIVFSSKKQIRRGYIILHPINYSCVSIREHVHIMRLHLGYWFSSKEYEVHHKNSIRDDNRIENLELVAKYPYRKKHRMIDELNKYHIENQRLKEEIVLMKEQ